MVTHAIHLLDAIARRMGVERPDENTLNEIKKDVSRDQIVAEIERAEETRETAGEP
jgi:hypothetical protein